MFEPLGDRLYARWAFEIECLCPVIVDDLFSTLNRTLQVALKFSENIFVDISSLSTCIKILEPVSLDVGSEATTANTGGRL